MRLVGRSVGKMVGSGREGRLVGSVGKAGWFGRLFGLVEQFGWSGWLVGSVYRSIRFGCRATDRSVGYTLGRVIKYMP